LYNEGSVDSQTKELSFAGDVLIRNEAAYVTNEICNFAGFLYDVRFNHLVKLQLI
jgi:hypothetical protein